MKKVRRLFAIAILSLVWFTAFPTAAIGMDVPTPPEEPVVATAPPAPSQPSAPSAPAPVEPPQPKRAETLTPTHMPTKEEATSTSSTPLPSSTPDPVTTDKQSTTVKSGNVTAIGTVTSLGSTNETTNAQSTAFTTPASSQTTSNGTESVNTTTDRKLNSQTIAQTNQAQDQTHLNLDADSGSNDASGNVGDTALLSGNANVSGTVIKSLNTNVDGVAVAQFDVADDHVGDIILDFSNAQSVSSLPGGTSQNGNGAGSQNAENASLTTERHVFQENDASIGNDFVLTADSGNNTASLNTGGDTVIRTGDANISATAVTLANNNIEGNVLLGVVNIYGNLSGDIVLPDQPAFHTPTSNSSDSQGADGNGSASTNSLDSKTVQDRQTFQQNDAVIDNTITVDATTGENSTSQNTGGDSVVQTGDTTVHTKTINVANTNIDGGNVWLVIINEAGKWIGKIIGATDGSTAAASVGQELSVDGQGNVVMNGNGSESANSVTTTQENISSIAQNNSAHIENNLTLKGNTGKNTANLNTGGDTAIKTGDVNVVANIVNFVNNNIVGTGKLIVTLVNVLGSWKGNFLPPGTTKTEATPLPAQAMAQPIPTFTPIPVLSQHVVQYYRTVFMPRPRQQILGATQQLPRSRQIQVSSHPTSSTQASKNLLAVADPKKNLGMVQPTHNVVQTKAPIRVNLAWGVLLIPVWAVMNAVRKYFLGA